MVKVQGDRVRYLRRDPDVSFLLMDEPKVPGVGPDAPTIRIGVLGEAPGRDEAAKGEPFVGKAGGMLSFGLSTAGMYKPGLYLTNVIDRRPPGNDISSGAAVECIGLEKEAFWEELRWLVEEKKLQVLIAMGNTAKNALGIPGSLSKVRGSVYEINLDWCGPVTDPQAEPCHFVAVPTYHPSYIMRTQNYSKTEKEVWLADMRKAKEIADKGYTRPKENFIRNPNTDQAIKFLHDAIRNDSVLAIDLETASLRPEQDNIVCVGMADSATHGICIPIYRTGENVKPYTRYWSQSVEHIILGWIQKALKECKNLIFQNALFDVNYLTRTGWRVPIENVRHDTMLLHHAVNPEDSHRLGHIVSVYGATPYWKEDFLKRDTSIWHMDFNDLQTYNIRDCVVLHQVLDPLLEDLAEVQAERAYEENMSLIGPVLMMQDTGVLISQKRLKAYRELKTSERDEKEAALLKDLPSGFELSKDSHIRAYLFGEYPSSWEAAANYAKHKPDTKVRKEKYELYKLSQELHPFSHGYRGKHTSSGLISVDKQGLHGLVLWVGSRLDELAHLKRPTEVHEAEIAELTRLKGWVTDFLEWRRLNKLITTYTEFQVGEDARVHTNLKIHGTVTGRLASSSPNLQNQPKGDVEFRKIFVAAPGHQIVSADYSNLEFRILAYETQDENLLRIVRENLNQHDENTKAMFSITPDDPMWGPCRRAAKTFQFGTQYGGGDRQVYEQICMAVPEMNLSYSRFRGIKSAYMRANAGYVRWAEEVKAHAKETRTVRNSFGRCRLLYGKDSSIEKEALNFPCQSGAAHIINLATVRIWRRLLDERFRSRLQMQIHDQLIAESPDDEVGKVVSLLREEMQRPIDYNGVEVVFPVDVETGPSWGELTACEN